MAGPIHHFCQHHRRAVANFFGWVIDAGERWVRQVADGFIIIDTQQLQNLTRVVTGPADSSVSSNPSPPKNSRALLLLVVVLILALVLPVLGTVLLGRRGGVGSASR